MKAISILLFLLATSPVSAQFNYYKTSLNLKYGFTKYYGDISSVVPRSPAFLLAIALRPIPEICLEAEVQRGTISAGDSVYDPHQRFFRNEYKAFMLNITSANDLKGFYIGIGAGLLVTEITAIKRTRFYPSGEVYVFPGNDRSKDLAIQALSGFRIFIKDKWAVNRYALGVEYRFVLTNGDGLDGYNDPPATFKNKSNDRFSLISLGLTWLFGPQGLSN